MPIATRIVTATWSRPDGTLAALKPVVYRLLPGSYSTSSMVPAAVIEDTTNDIGQTATALWVNAEGLTPTKWVVTAPSGEQLRFILPPGDTPIMLQELLELAGLNPWDDAQADLEDDELLKEDIYLALANTADSTLGDAMIGSRVDTAAGVSRTVHDRLADALSVMDFIPQAEHAAIFARTSTYDATAAIIAALAYGKLAGRMVRGAGGLLNISATIVVETSIDFRNTTLQTTNPNLIVLQVGRTDAGVQNLVLYLPDVVMKGHKAAAQNGMVADWGTGTGVRLVNIENSFVDFTMIRDFDTGLDVTAVGRGTAYLHIEGRHLYNNRRNLRVGPDISNPDGYTNDIKIHVERYSMLSDERGGVAQIPQLAPPVGSRHVLLDTGGAHPVNNVVVSEGSLEGNSPEFHAELIGTVSCKLVDCRWEVNAVATEEAWPRVKHASYTSGTVKVVDSATVQGGYNAHMIQYTETGSAPIHPQWETPRFKRWLGRGGLEGTIVAGTLTGTGDSPVIASTTASTLAQLQQPTSFVARIAAWLSAAGINLKKAGDSLFRWRVTNDAIVEFGPGDGLVSHQQTPAQIKLISPVGTSGAANGSLIIGNRSSANYAVVSVLGSGQGYTAADAVAKYVSSIGSLVSKFKAEADVGPRLIIDHATGRMSVSDGAGEGYLVTVTSGTTWTVTYSGQTTPALAFDIDAADLQTALAALSTIGTGNVLVSGAAPFVVRFVGVFANQRVATLTASGATVKYKEASFLREVDNILLINDGFKLVSTATLPTANASTRGQVRWIDGNPDRLVVCRKDAGSSYAWVDLF